MIRLLLAALLLALPARAEWPDRPIRIIVPFPPGGGTDNVARVLAQHLQTKLGQPVAVENRSGASGVIGTEAVARAGPDGTTLAMTASGPLSILPQMLSVPYDPLQGLTPVAIPSVGPLLMVLPVDRAPRDVASFIAWARAKPGGVNACSIGIASPSHLAAEMFFRRLDLPFTHVPHRGSGPALTDAIAGHCDVLFDSVGSAGPHVREGRLRALAITSAARSPGWPDLPTLGESGLPGYEAVTWSGLVAPPGMPTAIVQRLNAESRAAFHAPAARAALEAQGATISDLTPDGMRAFLEAEIARWGTVIRAGNIKAD